jgi:hypothetical protein
VLDYAAEVLGHGDRFTPPLAPDDGDVAVAADGTELSAGDLVSLACIRADALGLGPGGRLLTTMAPDALEPVLDAVLVPLVSGGVVLCRHPDPSTLERRAEQERVSVLLGMGPEPEPR